MPYRDSNEVLRERITELERSRGAIDCELATLRSRIADLRRGRRSDRLHFLSLMVAQSAPFVLVAALVPVGAAAYVATLRDWADEMQESEKETARIVGDRGDAASTVRSRRAPDDSDPSVADSIAPSASESEPLCR